MRGPRLEIEIGLPAQIGGYRTSGDER